LTKLAFIASGWLVQLCSKLTPSSIIKARNQAYRLLLV
jgi:hypothetical protein